MIAHYEQRTGAFTIWEYDDDGQESVVVQLRGFAGQGNCKNNHFCEVLPNRGPLPCGAYRILKRKHARFHGPAFYLEPFSTNDMFGRSGFWIHGGTESQGCIMLQHAARELIAQYRPTTLYVVPGEGPRSRTNSNLS